MNILLFRHGQTDSNAGGVLQGHLPTPLNALGHEQARRLAARLGRLVPPVGVLLTSDLRRARETAAPIEAALGLTAIPDPVWRERAFGSFEGRTVGDTEIWRAASGTLDPPGAERIDAMHTRVELALNGLLRFACSHAVVGVVTHGGVMRTALQLLSDGRLPLVDGHPTVEVGPILNASILRLEVQLREGPAGWRLLGMNDVEHLAETQMTARDAG